MRLHETIIINISTRKHGPAKLHAVMCSLYTTIENSGQLANQVHLVVWWKNTLYICVNELFCQRRECFQRAFYLDPIPDVQHELVFPYPLKHLQEETQEKNLFIHAKVGNKNVCDIIDVKLLAERVKCLDQDRMTKLLFKVSVYFQSPTRISKMFLIVFVLCTANMFFLKIC